ncbi:MAG: hypothetical protein EOO65_03585 [Methanosarcinales archaeon]|nr:MAG: hypothetical protein EOO65_03585 [Methanosarcinales archaeon]
MYPHTEPISPKTTQEAPLEAGHTADHPLTIRALVSTKEAGIIIGKAGATIAQIRNATGVKAGVSKVVQGVQDRVLSVSGEVEGIATAFSEVARLLLETPLSDSSLPPPPVRSRDGLLACARNPLHLPRVLVRQAWWWW